MKKVLYDILVFSADNEVSESLESLLFAINVRPKIIRDYSVIKDKITENTKALLIDEYVIHNGKKRHIKNLYKKYNFKIPILCLIENIPEANMNNSFINFFQKPLNKKTLSNALKPYLREASFSKINTIIKLGKFILVQFTGGQAAKIQNYDTENAGRNYNHYRKIERPR